eukprot:scaffold11380_cov97-Isochrysis_galbana.AAC.5
MREGNSPSWFNPDEASIVFGYVRDLLESPLPITPADIGIISPYNKQVRQCSGKGEWITAQNVPNALNRARPFFALAGGKDPEAAEQPQHGRRDQGRLDGAVSRSGEAGDHHLDRAQLERVGGLRPGAQPRLPRQPEEVQRGCHASAGTIRPGSQGGGRGA